MSSVSSSQQFLIIPDVGEPDPNSPDDPPAGWVPVEIDGSVHPLTSSILQYENTDDTFTVGATGGEIFSTDDSFAGFAYQMPASDFTITAQLVDTSEEVPQSKGGIDFRQILDPNSAHCLWASFASNGALVDCRATTDGATTSDYFSGVAVSMPECVRIERDIDIPSVKFFQKDSATDCAAGGYTEIHRILPSWAGSGQMPYVILATTPSQTGVAAKSATTRFTGVTVSTASVDHTPGDVAFEETAYAIAEDTTPVTLTVTRNGPATSSCLLNYTVDGGTAIPGVDFVDESGLLTWAIGETGDRTITVAIIDRANSQPSRQFTVPLTKNSCPDDLGDALATVTINDSDAGASFTAMSPTNTIWKDVACWGCDWSALFALTPTYDYRFIDNANTSGPGSFDAAISNCSTSAVKVIIPRIQARVVYPANSTKLIDNCDRMVYVGQAAPGAGFHVQRLRIAIRQSQFVFFDNFSCQNDSHLHAQEGQDRGHCINIDDNVSLTNADIVFKNYGCAFGFDSCIQMTSGTTRGTLGQGINLYPLRYFRPDPVNAYSDLNQISLLGDTNPADSTSKIAFIRNIGTNYTNRCAEIVEVDDMLMSNNICASDAANGSTVMPKIDRTGINMNVISNLYLYYAGATGNVKPIRFGGTLAGANNTQVATVYIAGNEAHNGPSYTTQADLIQHTTGSVMPTLPGSVTGNIPTGYVATTIGSTAAAKRAFAELLGRVAGPYAGIPQRLAIYQQAADEMEALFSGVGAQGETLESDEISDRGLSYPVVSTSPACDPFTANDCRPGMPALPDEAEAGDSDTFVNKLFTWINATDCVVAGEGATGCP